MTGKASEQAIREKLHRAASSIRKAGKAGKEVARIDWKDWERVRNSASNKTGWKAKEVDIWAIKEIELGQMIVNNTTTGEQHWLMDEKEREAKKAAAGSGPKADRAAMMRKVKRWIGKRKRGKWITAAMYRDVRDNLRTREKDGTRGSVKAVEAAIVMLLAEGDMMLEYRNRQEGKWMKGAMVWAMEQGWVSGIQAAAFMAGATDKVRYREGREMICLELGSGWRGANEGLTTTGDWDRVVDVDMKQQNLGKKLGMAKPDILARFLMPGQEGKGMVEYFRERSGAKPGEIAAIWASTNCDWASQATRLGVSRGIVMGPNSGGEVPEEEDRTIRGLIEGLQAARAEDPRVQYTWENTDGSLKDHEAMLEHMGESIKVRSCAYGRKSGKAYRIWLSPEARKYFDPILPADPDSMCEDCKAGRRQHQQGYCPQKGSKQKRISEEGQIGEAARQRVPKKLAQHLSKAMRAGWEEVNERLNGERT